MVSDPVEIGIERMSQFAQYFYRIEVSANLFTWSVYMLDLLWELSKLF
jgi:hypothetical protein